MRSWDAWLQKPVPCYKMNRKAYSYSCLIAKIPESLAQKVRDFGASIPNEDIYQDNTGERGRQEEIHITIKYGIHTTDVAEVLDVVEKTKPLKVKLGKTTIFWVGDSVVLKISVQSSDLAALNANVRRKLECTDTYPDYKPHITIAYLKKNDKNPYWFQKYMTNDFEGIELELNELIFSMSKGPKYKITLGDERIEDRISKVSKEITMNTVARELVRVSKEVMAGTWSLPKNDKDTAAIVRIVTILKAGDWPMTISPVNDAMYNLLGDDSMFDEFDSAGRMYLKECATAIVQRVRELAKDPSSSYRNIAEYNQIQKLNKMLR